MISISKGLESQNGLFSMKMIRNHEYRPCEFIKFEKGNVKKVPSIYEAKFRLSKTVPSKIDHLCGQEETVIDILKSFHQNEFVNLLGEPGIGKTSIAKEVANYINSRSLKDYSNGVIFLNLAKQNSLPQLQKEF